MTILAIVALYPLVGYLVFRGWARICPPVNGDYGNGSSIDRYKGWFLPAANGHTLKKYFGNNKRTVPFGISIETCLWLSLLGWPGVIVTFGGMFAGRAAINSAKHIALSATRAAVAPVTNVPDPDLIDAHREVEEICR